MSRTDPPTDAGVGGGDDRSDATAAGAADLLPHVYDELHRLAAGQLRHTLQATALVNEASLRLARQAGSSREAFLRSCGTCSSTAPAPGVPPSAAAGGSGCVKTPRTIESTTKVTGT